jgi:OOP family OmpA-OmpF porin
MKHLKLAMIALFMLVLVGSANAQDENNPWVVGFGINSVDIYSGSDTSNQFNDLLGSSDWNTLPSITRISAEKYLEKGFTLQLAGAFNQITTHLEKNDSDYLLWSVGALVKYDLNTLF